MDWSIDSKKWKASFEVNKQKFDKVLNKEVI